MRSHINADFRDCFRKLPKRARLDARAAYHLFKRDPYTNGLHFKEIYKDNRKSVWSVRTALGWRALGLRIRDDMVIWFWIGSHAEYDEWFRRFKKMSAPE